MRDTIFALSSGAPPAGVAVVRISGPNVRAALQALCGVVPEPRRAQLVRMNGADGGLIDRGIALFFDGPRSFTGEDVAELQIHGSRAGLAAILAALSALQGFRMAEPGEFTRRAFENGRMDLTAVEGLSDLIRAETEAQRRQAMAQAEGGLEVKYQGWAKRLTHARAMIEAELDFSDEEDIPGSVSAQIWADLSDLNTEIGKHLENGRFGEIVRDGYRVALVGAPNAGKSSLLNCLAKRDVAIVSDEPGTTRDIVEVRLDLNGYLVLLQDTAGLRESSSAVETEGIRRTVAAMGDADLVLEVIDPLTGSVDAVRLVGADYPRLTVWSKMDIPNAAGFMPGPGELVVSSKTGEGVGDLIAAISACLSEMDRSNGDSLPTRERHVGLLRSCSAEIYAALEDNSAPLEVRAELLRSAGLALGRITGRVDVEDLLGVIFSEFCVGK